MIALVLITVVILVAIKHQDLTADEYAVTALFENERAIVDFVRKALRVTDAGRYKELHLPAALMQDTCARNTSNTSNTCTSDVNKEAHAQSLEEESLTLSLLERQDKKGCDRVNVDVRKSVWPRYRPRIMSTNQVSWKAKTKDEKSRTDKKERSNKAASSVDHSSAETKSDSSNTEKDTEKDAEAATSKKPEKIHKFLAFALILPSHEPSLQLQESLRLIAPLYSNITTIVGNALEFTEFLYQYDVHSFPKVLLFKEGKLAARFDFASASAAVSQAVSASSLNDSLASDVQYASGFSPEVLAVLYARWSKNMPDAAPVPYYYYRPYYATSDHQPSQPSSLDPSLYTDTAIQRQSKSTYSYSFEQHMEGQQRIRQQRLHERQQKNSDLVTPSVDVTSPSYGLFCVRSFWRSQFHRFYDFGFHSVATVSYNALEALSSYSIVGYDVDDVSDDGQDQVTAKNTKKRKTRVGSSSNSSSRSSRSSSRARSLLSNAYVIENTMVDIDIAVVGTSLVFIAWRLSHSYSVWKGTTRPEDAVAFL